MLYVIKDFHCNYWVKSNHPCCWVWALQEQRQLKIGMLLGMKVHSLELPDCKIFWKMVDVLSARTRHADDLADTARKRRLQLTIAEKKLFADELNKDGRLEFDVKGRVFRCDDCKCRFKTRPWMVKKLPIKSLKIECKDGFLKTYDWKFICTNMSRWGVCRKNCGCANKYNYNQKCGLGSQESERMIKEAE